MEVVPIPAAEEAAADPSLAAFVQTVEVASLVAGTVAVAPIPAAVPGLVPMFVEGSIHQAGDGPVGQGGVADQR